MAVEEEIYTVDLRISKLTQHAILHSCIALSPVGIKLPGSGTHRIEQFCSDILAITQNPKSSKKKKKVQLAEQRLVPEVEVLKFYEGACSPKEFAKVVCEHLCRHLNDLAEGGVTEEVREICWKVYSECQKFNITYPKWLVGDSTYSLWLVFCSLLTSYSEYLDHQSTKEILMRVFTLSGYSWSDGPNYEPPTEQIIDFPVFLECLVKCFSSLDLHPTVVTELIFDLKDEIVHGVLRKGYIKKKGHKARTIKRRWFVLTRNYLVYYKSRDKMEEKGRLVLSPKTDIKILPDKADRKHVFSVTCGKSGKEYELYSDDNRTRNEWILDIEKAIQLENALTQRNEEDFTQSMGHFFRLRYGTASPSLSRADSLLKRITPSFSPDAQSRVCRASSGTTISRGGTSHFSTIEGVGVCRLYTIGDGVDKPDSPLSSSAPVDDVYMDMEAGQEPNVDIELNSSDSEDDEHGYTFMFRGTEKKGHDNQMEKINEDCVVENSNPDDEELDKKNDDACLPYELVNPPSPTKHVSKDKNTSEKDPENKSDVPDKESSKSLKLKPTVSGLYLKINELESQSDAQNVPVPPPRPPETLTKNISVPVTTASATGESASVSGQGDKSSPLSRKLSSEIYSSPRFTTPTSQHRNNNEMHSSLSSPTSNPVPPPRPIETLTHFDSRHIINAQLDSEYSTESDNVPPAVPARDPRRNWETDSVQSPGGSSSGSPSRMRHPPYSSSEAAKTNEQELYYIVPNSPSMKM